MDQQYWERKGEGNKMSTEAFHWAWIHNILQIKGNQTVYQKKRYIMISIRMVKMKKHKRQYDNISHESLMEETVIANRPPALQMSN